MALRVIMLRKKLTTKQAELDALRETAAGFAQREAELEAAINEAATDEEREVVEAEVSAFEADQSANEEAARAAEAEISELETQINEAEQRARQARDAAHGAAGENKTRKDGCPMSTPETRTKFFNMTIAQRDAFFAREDVCAISARSSAAYPALSSAYPPSSSTSCATTWSATPSWSALSVCVRSGARPDRTLWARSPRASGPRLST